MIKCMNFVDTKKLKEMKQIYEKDIQKEDYNCPLIIGDTGNTLKDTDHGESRIDVFRLEYALISLNIIQREFPETEEVIDGFIKNMKKIDEYQNNHDDSVTEKYWSLNYAKQHPDKFEKVLKKNNCNTCKYPEFADLYNKFTDDVSEADEELEPRIELIYDKYICNKGYDELIPVYCIILDREVECKRMIEYATFKNEYDLKQKETANLIFYNALEKLLLKEIEARLRGII